jgi:hypothetical protein
LSTRALPDAKLLVEQLGRVREEQLRRQRAQALLALAGEVVLAREVAACVGSLRVVAAAELPVETLEAAARSVRATDQALAAPLSGAARSAPLGLPRSGLVLAPGKAWRKGIACSSMKLSV